MDKVRITLERTSTNEAVVHLETHDEEVINSDCVLKVMRHVEVHDSRAVNDSEIVHQQRVHWMAGSAEVPLPLSDYGLYSYHGEQIDVCIKVMLHVDDALIFDTKIHEEFDLPLAVRSDRTVSANQLIDPDDIYSFFDNFSSIPGRSQVRVVAIIMLLALGSILIVGVAFTKGSFVFGIFALVGVALGARALYGQVKNQLRGYLEVGEGVRKLAVVRGESLDVDELVDARAAIHVDELRVRIVAVNIECGQYRRGSGTNVRTVSFRQPVRGVLLFDRTIHNIEQGESLADHLRDDIVSFDGVFESLYPPNVVSYSHGLDIRWEVQILHDDFVDHEFVGRNEVFEYRDFLERGVPIPEADVIW